MLVKLFIHVFLLDDLFYAISEVIDIDSLWLVTVKSFHNLRVKDHPCPIDWLKDIFDLIFCYAKMRKSVVGMVY